MQSQYASFIAAYWWQSEIILLAQLTDMIYAFYSSLLRLAKTNSSRCMHLHFIAGKPFPMACLRDIAHVMQIACSHIPPEDFRHDSSQLTACCILFTS